MVESLHLPALASIYGLKIKWVCDSSIDRARFVARTWDVGRAFAQIANCSSDVDAVLIATPVGTRRRILDETIERGWHALCEKPFALDASEHRDMLEAAAQKGVKLGAGYMRRYYWAVRQAREMLRSKVLGPLKEVVASESARLEATGLDPSSYRNSAEASGGGVLMETGCHLLDEVFFVCDAVGANVQTCTQQIWGDYETETIASGCIALGSGQHVALQVAVSGIRPVFAGIAFRCELGELRVHFDPGRALEVLFGSTRPYRMEVPNPRHDQRHVAAAFRSEWVHFVEAIQTRSEWDLDHETGLITSDFITQCRQMAKESPLEARG